MIDEQLFFCNKCERMLSGNQFSRDKKATGRNCLDYTCKKCRSSGRPEKTDWQKQIARERSTRWRLKHSERNRAYQLERKQKDFKSFLTAKFLHAKAHSKKKCQAFDIDLSYLMDLLAENDERCAVMKIKMTHIVGSPKAVSIDRIDNLKGYIKGNVQLVCQFYNYGKNDCKDDDVRSLMREAIDVNQACQV